MKEAKVLLIICEGMSDDVTIHRPIAHFVNQNDMLIKVETTFGDIAYKKNINESNCVKHIQQIVDDFKMKMFLSYNDFWAIIHLVDTDGAFMNEENIIESKISTKNIFEENTLITSSIKSTKKQFQNKKKIYQKLFSISQIKNIPYYKFYLSRNLEHALYDLPNATLDEKIKLSRQFDARYKEDCVEFEAFLKEVLFSIPSNYQESWEYIFKDNNAIKRGTNLYILLQILKTLLEEN